MCSGRLELASIVVAGILALSCATDRATGERIEIILENGGRAIGEVRLGALDGVYQEFDSSGALAERGYFDRGVRHGPWERYKDGELLSYEFFDMGKSSETGKYSGDDVRRLYLIRRSIAIARAQHRTDPVGAQELLVEASAALSDSWSSLHPGTWELCQEIRRVQAAPTPEICE